jgi:beta-glucanase (GH16 family)
MQSTYFKLNATSFWVFFTVTMFFGCKVDDVQKIDKKNWTLVWADEFNGDLGTSPDSTKWTYDIGRGDNGWGNQELQSYTKRPSNVSMNGKGELEITARRESFGGADFTSSRIKTQGLFSQTYGRYEARLKTPFGPGIWPAFWMLGANIKDVPWPKCGEIDIMELRGQEPNIIHGSIHGPGYSGGAAITKGYGLQNNRFDNEFHVFAVEWEENKIDFYVDDYLYHRIEKSSVPGEWVYNNPFFLIFNIAVGGNYVGFPTASTPFPQKMIIDYVRVYK